MTRNKKRTRRTIKIPYRWDPPGKATPDEAPIYVNKRELLHIQKTLGHAGKKGPRGLLSFYMDDDSGGGTISGATKGQGTTGIGTAAGGGSQPGKTSSSGTGARGPTGPTGSPSRTGSNQPAGSSSVGGVSGGKPSGGSPSGGGGQNTGGQNSGRGPSGPQGQNSGFNQGGGGVGSKGSGASQSGSNNAGGGPSTSNNAGRGPQGPQGQSTGDKAAGVGSSSNKVGGGNITGGRGPLGPQGQDTGFNAVGARASTGSLIGGRVPGSAAGLLNANKSPAASPTGQRGPLGPQGQTTGFRPDPSNPVGLPGAKPAATMQRPDISAINDLSKSRLNSVFDDISSVEVPDWEAMGYPSKWDVPTYNGLKTPNYPDFPDGKTPQTMSLQEVSDYGDQMIDAQIAAGIPAKKASSAIGGLQITGTNIRNLAEQMNMDMNTTMFDEKTQKAMGQKLAADRVAAGQDPLADWDASIGQPSNAAVKDRALANINQGALNANLNVGSPSTSPSTAVASTTPKANVATSAMQSIANTPNPSRGVVNPGQYTDRIAPEKPFADSPQPEHEYPDYPEQQKPQIGGVDPIRAGFERAYNPLSSIQTPKAPGTSTGPINDPRREYAAESVTRALAKTAKPSEPISDPRREYADEQTARKFDPLSGIQAPARAPQQSFDPLSGIRVPARAPQQSFDPLSGIRAPARAPQANFDPLSGIRAPTGVPTKAPQQQAFDPLSGIRTPAPGIPSIADMVVPGERPYRSLVDPRMSVPTEEPQPEENVPNLVDQQYDPLKGYGYRAPVGAPKIDTRTPDQQLEDEGITTTAPDQSIPQTAKTILGEEPALIGPNAPHRQPGAKVTQGEETFKNAPAEQSILQQQPQTQQPQQTTSTDPTKISPELAVHPKVANSVAKQYGPDMAKSIVDTVNVMKSAVFGPGKGSNKGSSYTPMPRYIPQFDTSRPVGAPTLEV